MHCTLRTLPPSPPHSNTHCHESSENFLYKIYQVLGILPILINNRSDTVVQWISAGLVWSRTWVQSYKKLDFFSVIGNRISNTSYHFQYLYYPGGNETGAKPNLITCITEIFLSAGGASFELFQLCRRSSTQVKFCRKFSIFIVKLSSGMPETFSDTRLNWSNY